MALADKETSLKRIIGILNANPGVWSDSVAGDIGAFPSDAEILEALFEADELICTQGYFQSVNKSLSEPFKVFSSVLTSGTKIPFHYGEISKVEILQASETVEDVLTQTFRLGIDVKSIDDITTASNNSQYAGVGAFNHLYKISGGVFYTPNFLGGRVEYAQYTRGADPQVNQSETYLLVCTTVRLLTKHSSPVDFASQKTESERGIQQLIADGVYQEQQGDDK